MLNTEPDLGLDSESPRKRLHVCVAVIERRCAASLERQFLIAKRPEHLHQGGRWEFPGGKVEQGENVTNALNRELNEELGISLIPDGGSFQGLSPLIQIEHTYPEKNVFLDVIRVQSYSGQEFGREGQEIRWISAHELSDYTFPDANTPIVKACLLPTRYFITPEYASVWEAEKGLRDALNMGAELIYFRQPSLNEASYIDWVARLLGTVPNVAEVLMLSNAEALARFDCAGVHLSAYRAADMDSRPINKDKLLSVACHNEQELQHASRLQADFVTLSPVKATSSHPGQAGMGWTAFKKLVSQAKMPVYGLGGVLDRDLQRLQQSGAQGLAGIGFWQRDS